MGAEEVNKACAPRAGLATYKPENADPCLSLSRHGRRTLRYRYREESLGFRFALSISSEIVSDQWVSFALNSGAKTKPMI